MQYRALFLVFLVIFMTGCTASTAVQRYKDSKSAFDPGPELMEHNFPEKDVYRVHEQGGSGFVSINAVRESAERRATEFCERQDKGIVILGEKASQPPYILGNFPRVEVVFAAVDRRSQSPLKGAAPDDPYDKLARLKQLLDNGTLTQAEFDREKAKVLGFTR